MVGIPEVGIATHFPRRGHDQKTVSVGYPSQIRQLRTESSPCSYDDILQGQYNLPPIARLGSDAPFSGMSVALCAIGFPVRKEGAPRTREQFFGDEWQSSNRRSTVCRGLRPLSHGKCSWNPNFLSGRSTHKSLRFALT